ncbi:hypothetical protein F5Y16DRAFT_369022 [Xylariaceae sp. FL0255]|nr:hypothetical protein F5Y16DRAFT_369022 [Xylariaceae sp. FL0255]
MHAGILTLSFMTNRNKGGPAYSIITVFPFYYIHWSLGHGGINHSAWHGNMHSVLYLFFLLIAAQASTGLPARSKSDFDLIGQDLNLTNSAAQLLKSRYAQASTDSDMLAVACLAAQMALGDAQVETMPLLNESIVDENWSQTCWFQPECIVQPQNTSQVAASLKIVSFFSSQFAVRSGGHSPNPGWSSIGTQGLLLDLGRLDNVQLSSDGSFASIGPGATWGQVYATLDAVGAVVPGGREPTIGVGGLVIGGGMSHVSNQFGLVADNVKTFEVVLANGSVVDANLVSHPDLFWALKGGGPNFGIVTRFDIYTAPVHDIWVQINVYSTNQAPGVLAALVAWQLEGAEDTKSNVEVNIALDSVVAVLIYAEPSSGPPAAFAVFMNSTNLPPLEVALPGMNVTYNELSIILATAVSSTPARHDYRATSTRIDSGLVQAVYSFWREKALDVYNATGANQSFVIQHIGTNLINKSLEEGGNPMNIPTGPQQWWTTIADWTDEKDDALVRSVSVETTKQWETLGSERGLNLSFIFMNDASRDQNPLASYGASSLSRLNEIAALYDVKAVFQTLQYGGFLLSRAGR